MTEHDNTLIKSPSHIPPLNHPAACYMRRWRIEKRYYING